MNIIESTDGFVISFNYDPALVAAVKLVPGRRFDRESKCWTVPRASAAPLAIMVRQVRESGREVEAPHILEAAEAAHAQAIEQSRAADADVDIPVPDGLALLPFQKAGVQYAAQRPNALIADEMGLGKTLQAIGVSNMDPTVRNVLIICPASLKINWAREWAKWDVKALSVGIANGALPSTNVVILNFDVLKKHIAAIHARAWDLLIVDEAHYLKNSKAQRTALVLGKWDRDPAKVIKAIVASRRLMLTGTPILNRPIEAWGIIHSLAPETFRNWRTYAVRYCAGVETEYGWDVTGASHLSELQDLLRSTIMVRRLKKDVLTELPAKRRQVIELPDLTGAVAAEDAVTNAIEAKLESLRVAVELAKADDEATYETAVRALRNGTMAAFTEMARLRHDTAIAKLPQVIDHLTNILEETDGKIICFAHHHDVIDQLVSTFHGNVVVTGETKMVDRQAAVDRFQTDPTCRLFIGNIQAAGVGLTLTASAHVVFAEIDWVPGNLSQAEDRAHRIGQRDSVLVQHLVLEGSLDATMAKRVVEKQEIIDKALDDPIEIQQHAIPALPPKATEVERDTPIVPVKILAATESTTRAKIIEVALTLTATQITAIHRGLQMLAGMCDGAQVLDGRGYSKIDTVIGHSLAAQCTLTPRQAALGQKLVNKYRRQLPPDLVAQAKQHEAKEEVAA